MTAHLPDAAVLMHCLRMESPFYAPCRNWLDAVVISGTPLLLTELVETAFLNASRDESLRIAPVPEALAFWKELMRLRNTARLTPGSRHSQTLQQLIESPDSRELSTRQLWLASMAIDAGATVISLDPAYALIPDLKIKNPMRPSA